MDIILRIFSTLLHYTIEVLPSLAAGFLISGIVHEFVPTGLVEKHLGGKGIRPLLYATMVGTILPICCVGSLPVALSLHKKGASTGAVVAFLVATPATSISALLVSYSLLGLKFTIFLFSTVIAIGIIMGFLADIFKFEPISESPPDFQPNIDPVCGMTVAADSGLRLDYNGQIVYFCSQHCIEAFRNAPEQYISNDNNEACSIEEHRHEPKFGNKIISALKFAFIEMPRDIGLEVIVGMVLAAVVASIDPIGVLIRHYLAGFWAFPFSLVSGLLMYVCSTASVPLVAAFLSTGLNPGAGMVFLIVGPVTSWGTILVIKKHFGGRMLAFYLISLGVLTLFAGILFIVI